MTSPFLRMTKLQRMMVTTELSEKEMRVFRPHGRAHWKRLPLGASAVPREAQLSYLWDSAYKLHTTVPLYLVYSCAGTNDNTTMSYTIFCCARSVASFPFLLPSVVWAEELHPWKVVGCLNFNCHGP